VRRALGIRRTWRQKVAPFVLLAIAVVPAIVNVGVKYLTRDTPASDIDFITYREYVGVSNALLVFVALTAPDIMCPDRRQRVLPLIFARPLTGVDYVFAKVGAMFSILFAFSFIPQVILFVGQMLVSDDGALRYLRDNAEVLWQVPVAVAALSLLYAAIGVAIASLTARRIIAGATTVGLFLVTSIVSAILVGEEEVAFNDGSAAGLINLAALPLHLRDVIFLGHVDPEGPLGGVANGGLLAAIVFVVVVGACLATLVYRYNEVER
jgi:ABC-2 type transport system permease protein